MQRILISALLFLGCFGTASAQSNPTTFAARLCIAGSFSFPCPAGYDIKNALGGVNPYLAIESQSRIAVFAFVPRKELSEDELIKEALTRSFQILFGTNYGELKTKDSKDFWGDDKWSEFEVSKFAKAAIDEKNNLAFHYQYAHLKIKDKHVIAGFVYDPATAQTPETWYKTWTGGGFGDASDALQELILSITKEKRSEFSPGGPPPVAAPPKKN